MRSWIHANRSRIHSAIYDDFRKPPMETDATEVFHVLAEIKTALKSLHRWASPTQVPTPLHLIGTQSWIQPEARGVCLIISPWNYPFSLAVGPLVSALAAGNAVVLKPSEVTPSVSTLIREMCDQVFDPSIVAVCEGGPEISQALLALPFDHIFFTGSPTVGRIVMRAAAEHLASVTLELGGKSPAIVCPDAWLDDTAKRIAVGKFINNGQTCIAPDYILVHRSIERKFIDTLVHSVNELYVADRNLKASEDYGRIVNQKHFDRLEQMIDESLSLGARIEMKGNSDRASRFIHPVILSGVSADSRMMKEEIFGPILPVVSYDDLSDAIEFINKHPKPLALYLFSSDKSVHDQVVGSTSSGSVCINDCGIQFLHTSLPFGGINNSGIGNSHGYFGFRAFSHEKPVLTQKRGITSISAFYPPFTQRTKRLMDWFLRLF